MDMLSQEMHCKSLNEPLSEAVMSDDDILKQKDHSYICTTTYATCGINMFTISDVNDVYLESHCNASNVLALISPTRSAGLSNICRKMNTKR